MLTSADVDEDPDIEIDICTDADGNDFFNFLTIANKVLIAVSQSSFTSYRQLQKYKYRIKSITQDNKRLYKKLNHSILEFEQTQIVLQEK